MKKKNNHEMCFYYVLWVPVFLVGLLFLSGDAGAYLFRIFGSGDITYVWFDDNIFKTLVLFFVVLDFVILSFYFTKLLGKDMGFNSRYIGSVIDAKTITRNCLVVCSFVFLLATSFLLLSVNSRIEANNEGLKKYNIIEQDTIIFNYDEAKSVDVYLEWVNRGKHNNGYVTVIEVKTESDVYSFDSIGFSDDYYYIEMFLSNFKEDMINVDKTFADKTEEIIGYYEQVEAFEKIYK